MKRYNLTVKTTPGNDTWAESSRIKITEDKAGQWIRYEDAFSDAIKTYIDFRVAGDGAKDAFKNAVKQVFYDTPEDDLTMDMIVTALKELIGEWEK